MTGSEADITRVCPRCRSRPRAPGEGYCVPCRRKYQRDRRRGNILDITRITDSEGRIVKCGVCLRLFTPERPRVQTKPICQPCHQGLECFAFDPGTIKRAARYAEQNHDNPVQNEPQTYIDAEGCERTTSTPGVILDTNGFWRYHPELVTDEIRTMLLQGDPNWEPCED